MCQSDRKGRKEGVGGGCVTFVKEGIPYRQVENKTDMEGVIIEVWVEERKMVIINFYNPCRKLELSKLDELERPDRVSTMWCGDFNAHNTLWGSEKTYQWAGSRRADG